MGPRRLDPPYETRHPFPDRLSAVEEGRTAGDAMRLPVAIGALAGPEGGEIVMGRRGGGPLRGSDGGLRLVGAGRRDFSGVAPINPEGVEAPAEGFRVRCHAPASSGGAGPVES